MKSPRCENTRSLFNKRALLFLLFLLVNSQVKSQHQNFPYTYDRKDLVLAPLSVMTTVTSTLLGQKKERNLTMDEIGLLNPMDVNSFDRSATDHWNTSAVEFSDIPFKIMPLIPIVLVIPQLKNKKWDNALTFGLMYTEVMFFTIGVTGITKSLTGRIRPYLYNSSFTVEERFNLQENGAPVANTSFFSGHSSMTFAFAVFLSKTYTDIYGKSVWSKVIWGTSLTLATATAYARVEGGVHFPTDVIVGALVGSAIGYTIPVIHKINSEKLSFTVVPNYIGIAYKL